MNDETRDEFLNLYLEMVLASYQSWGEILDQIRIEIEGHGYSRGHQNDLGIILQRLKRGNNSELSRKLQSIIDLLGDPQHI